MHISDTTIYVTDNGAAYCGQHLGSTAKATGHDLSGQPILPITPELAREAQAMGYTPTCEHCGRTASLLVSA